MSAPRHVNYDETLLKVLKNPVEAAAFIEAVIEMDDPAALAVAFRKVAQAHGITEVASHASIGDKTLFRTLSENVVVARTQG